MRDWCRLFIILMSLLLLQLESGKGQPVFANDTSFRPIFQSLVDKIDSSFHLQPNAEFEMRFWINISKVAETRLFILSLHDGRWSARFFKKPRKFVDTLFEVPVKQSGLEKLWKDLSRNELLTIKDSDSLYDKTGRVIDDPVYDGATYGFEFTTLNARRRYSYTCPKSFSERYPYVKEYRKVINIVTLIYKHCLEKLYIC